MFRLFLLFVMIIPYHKSFAQEDSTLLYPATYQMKDSSNFWIDISVKRKVTDCLSEPVLDYDVVIRNDSSFVSLIDYTADKKPTSNHLEIDRNIILSLIELELDINDLSKGTSDEAEYVIYFGNENSKKYYKSNSLNLFVEWSKSLE